MGKSERAEALTTRRNCIAIIKNLRYTRRYLASHDFDEKTFSHLNGSDRGIENLVGRNISFSLLTDEDKLGLHREISSKLNEVEMETFTVLRKAVIDYFKDVEAVIDNVGYRVPEDFADNMTSTKESAIESFGKTMNAVEAFDAFGRIQRFVAERIFVFILTGCTFTATAGSLFTAAARICFARQTAS